MTTFVLVHGAWAGAHGWRSVRILLAGEGHEVFTPSLTGIGERVHLASPQIDLTTHVNDVVNQIVFEDLRDIVLVGYSYGGVVVTAAVEHVHDRIRELVYLDAFVPLDGDSAFDALGADGPTLIGLGDEWLVPPPARDYDDPDEAAWQRPRRVAHPVRCFTEPVHLAQPLEEYGFGLTYIKASTRAHATRPVATRSGRQRSASRHQPVGATTRSTRTTWSPAIDRVSSLNCSSKSPVRARARRRGRARGTSARCSLPLDVLGKLPGWTSITSRGGSPHTSSVRWWIASRTASRSSARTSATTTTDSLPL